MKLRRCLLDMLVIVGFAGALVIVLPGHSRAQSAKETFAQRCQGCHGATGKGDGPAAASLKPPPSDFAVALKGKSDGWIAKAIKEGGPAVGESPMMPGYSDLSDQQLKELVDYIKKLHS